MITTPVKNPQFQPRMRSYEHQSSDLERSKDLQQFAVFWEMGLGKTKLCLETAAHLYLKGEIDGVLVVAPKGGYMNWIVEEIPKHLPAEVGKYAVAHYSAAMTRAQKEQLDSVMGAQNDVLDFMIMNFEAIGTQKGYSAALTFATNHYTLMIVDESIFIKSPNAQRTKATIKIGRKCDYRRILSGIPVSQGPTDLYSQLEFLGEGRSGFSSFWAFKTFYSIVVPVTYGTRRFNKVTGYRNLPELASSMKSFSSRRLKSECLDLPEKIFENVYVDWTPQQENLYNDLKNGALARMGENREMSVTNALELLTRLHQINCGHFTDDNGIKTQIPNNRIGAMLDLVELISGKIVIWARFRDDITAIVRAINDQHGELTAVHYYGGTTQTDRLEHLALFKNDPGCRILVANPASAGRALTLTQAHTAIYYSYSYVLEEYLQSQDRIHRIGQSRTCTYISLIIRGTVDEKVMRALQAKEDVAQQVMNMGVESLM